MLATNLSPIKNLASCLKVSADLYTNVKPPLLNEGDSVIFDDQLQDWKYVNKGSETLQSDLKSLKEKKRKEIRIDYELAQQVLIKNGKAILIRIMGNDYSDLQREFNKRMKMHINKGFLYLNIFLTLLECLLQIICHKIFMIGLNGFHL
jgi:hypothetical protein